MKIAALMRFLICIAGIFYLSFTSVSAQTKETLNKMDKAGKKQGYWKRLDQNGKLVYEGKFLNDQPIGTFKYYYENGKVRAITDFNPDGKNAKSQLFSEEGNKLAEGRYVDQKKDGIWKYYNSEDILISEEGYANGKKDGSYKTFYKSGNVAEEKFWKNDVEEGPWRQLFEDGTPRAIGNYVHGFLDGKIVFYYANGKPRIAGVYQDAVRDSVWMYYKETGEVDYTEKYVLGILKEGSRNEELLTPEEIEKLKQDYEKENETYQLKPGHE